MNKLTKQDKCKGEIFPILFNNNTVYNLIAVGDSR